MHGVRRKGKARTRILYWFRTPPGVRVGRAALDEAAIREIEASHPNIEFDWTRILKEGEEPVQERRRAERRSQGQRAPAPNRRAANPAPAPERNVEVHAVAIPEAVESADVDGATGAEEPTTAAYARLGSEGLARLRGRYAEVRTRITDRIQDPAAGEELKSLAERLNPDVWVTDDDVVAGLEGYEATFDALRRALGGRGKPAEPRQDEAPPEDAS